ncbi:MAG: helix-turn-helix transcriptional regulator [Sporomusaceae bacterium]|nr:helix-turn-helix transcriptional regulator [Sporomusaceae bacterium]
MEICDAIKQIRLELGLTQVAFAKKLHVSFSTVNRWENGRVQPNRLATMMIISVSDKVSINYEALEILKRCIGDE